MLHIGGLFPTVAQAFHGETVLKEKHVICLIVIPTKTFCQHFV